MTEKTILIDSAAIFFRYYYALPLMLSKDNMPVGGIYGFFKQLLAVFKDRNNYSLILLFDKAKSNIRKKIHEFYKMDRAKDPAALEQLNYLLEICENIGFFCDYHSEYEADDLIAAYTYKSLREDKDVIILTADKDLYQLVNERVSIFNPFNNITYTPLTVLEKMGVYPKDIPLFLALCGDSSDNIPGIKGIGPKKAQKIINSLGGDPSLLIEKISQEARDIPLPILTETLNKMMSLTSLYGDIPTKYELIYFDLNKVLEKMEYHFKTLGFYSLLEYMIKSLNAPLAQRI